MYSLIYRSVARESFSKPLIYKMLSEAREFNAAHGITGCLLYHQGQFIQLLEGAYDEVQSLFERIQKDERHHQVEVLEKEVVTDRIFDKWSMAFQDLGDEYENVKYKEMIIHTYFTESRIFEIPSKTGLALFKGVQAILSAEDKG